MLVFVIFTKIGKTLKSEKFLIIFAKIWTEKAEGGLDNGKTVITFSSTTLAVQVRFDYANIICLVLGRGGREGKLLLGFC